MKKLILALAALSLSTVAFANAKPPEKVDTPAFDTGKITTREVTAAKKPFVTAITAYNKAPRTLQSTLGTTLNSLNTAVERVDLAVKAKNRDVFKKEEANIRTHATTLCASVGCVIE